jgi:hypothetical protein
MRINNLTIVVAALLLTSCIFPSAPVPTETISLTLTPTFSPSISEKTLTAKELLSLIPTPLPTPTFLSAPSERPDYDQVSGKYLLDRGENGGCVLNVVLEPTNEIGFDLFCIRGALSYNSGYGIGKILIRNNVAVYSPRFFSGDVCNIVFQFEEDKVTVTQFGSDFDCGFGHAVYADGVYELVDIKPPQLGCLHGENSCQTPLPNP